MSEVSESCLFTLRTASFRVFHLIMSAEDHSTHINSGPTPVPLLSAAALSPSVGAAEESVAEVDSEEGGEADAEAVRRKKNGQ